jgi:hypothetical protein
LIIRTERELLYYLQAEGGGDKRRVGAPFADECVIEAPAVTEALAPASKGDSGDEHRVDLRCICQGGALRIRLADAPHPGDGVDLRIFHPMQGQPMAGAVYARQHQGAAPSPKRPDELAGVELGAKGEIGQHAAYALELRKVHQGWRNRSAQPRALRRIERGAPSKDLSAQGLLVLAERNLCRFGALGGHLLMAAVPANRA